MVRTRRKANPVRRVINIEDAADCRFWTRALGVNMADLKEAVKEVGVKAEEVRHYLAIRHHRRVQRE
ncbi:MAG TPA: DUF3606 domain-containing protein, partial [Burkholderiales bacterium]|nr:DUF3606 domain-containing protein [Burkholderiales bacterium]